MTVQEIKNRVWEFLIGKNLSEKSVSAIMGNIHAESGFSPNLVEVGNGIGFGLCQWSFGRRTQLESYGTDLTHQLNFLWAELSGVLGSTGADFQWINKSGYLKHTDFMSGNGSIDDLTSAFCFCWERPNFDLSHIDVRIAKAKEFYDEYANGVEPPEPEEPEPPEGGGDGEEGEEDLRGEVWDKILTTSYNINQLTTSEIDVIKKACFGDVCNMIHTFDRSKKYIGSNYLASRLTFDSKDYILIDVRRNGYICIDYNDSKCYKYVNPKYLIIQVKEDEEETEDTEDGETEEEFQEDTE